MTAGLFDLLSLTGLDVVFAGKNRGYENAAPGMKIVSLLIYT